MKNLKEQFLEILEDDYTPSIEKADKLLVLFGVSTRTFHIGDKVKWRGMDLIVVEVGVGEVLIATSENVDDENYNDWWVRSEYVC